MKSIKIFFLVILIIFYTFINSRVGSDVEVNSESDDTTITATASECTDNDQNDLALDQRKSQLYVARSQKWLITHFFYYVES